MKKEVDKLKLDMDKLALTHQRRDGVVGSLIEDFETSGEEDARVLPQLLQRIVDLGEVITGEKTTYENALKVGKDTLASHGGQVSLVAVIGQADRAMVDVQAKLADEIREWRNDQERANQEVVNKNAQVSNLQEELRKRDEEIVQLKVSVAAFRQEHDKLLNDTRTDFADERRDLDAKIAELVQDLSEAKVQLKQKDREILSQERQLANLIAMKREGGIIFDPDGLVVEVVSDKVVYINIGKINNVIPGLTFGVYPPSGKFEDLKAKLVVVKVHDKASECRVVELMSQRHPITENDLLYDIAFSETRSFTFVIEGRFDLHGTGRATIDDTKEAVAMVKRFGGIVATEVTPGVDFIVLGEEPERPMQPSEEADPTIWQAYQENMKIYESYVKIGDEAERLGLPILNTNRFLDLVGYKPIQTLKY